MGTRASRLFHTIVVVGTSLGCGAETTVIAPAGAGDASAGGSDASPNDAPQSDASPIDTGASDTDTAESEAGPRNACDCVRPGTFRCDACASGMIPIEGRCVLDDGVGCVCDDSVAIAAPSDCALPTQFVCNYAPNVDPAFYESPDAGPGLASAPDDWYAFVQCSCTGPLTSASCTAMCPECFLECTTFECPPGTVGGASQVVVDACACQPPPVIIR